MQIVDVMRHLNTEYEIRFLLTAYLENLQSRDAIDRLVPGVAALPLGDAQDIQSRFSELLGAEWSQLTGSSRDTQGVTEREATEIFGAAVTRLHALRARADSPTPARLDEGQVPDDAHAQERIALSF